MSVSAHTNAVGIHTLSEWRTERSKGVRYSPSTGNLEPFETVIDQFPILVARSAKPPTYIWGDHKTAYDYSRGISRVLEDNPVLKRSRWINPVDGKTSSYDYVTEMFLSKAHGPFGYNPVPAGVLDDVEDTSVTKSLNSLRQESSEVGADLGQWRQTVDQLANSVRRGANFIRHMKHGRFAEAADDLGLSTKAFSKNRGKAIADYWLEYSYGWKPLADDIHTTSQVLQQQFAKRHLIEGTGTRSVSGSVEFDWGSTHQKAVWKCSSKTVNKGLLWSDTAYRMSQLGVTNPASVAWELVPFSFVVDWFIPVGNTLSACMAGFGLTFVGGYSSIRAEYELEIVHKSGRLDSWTVVEDPGLYREGELQFWRKAFTAFPRARFYADSTPYSTPRAANALALVRQIT